MAPAARDIVKRLPMRLVHDAEARRQMRVEAEILAALAGRGAPDLRGHGEDETGPWLRTAKIPWPTLGAHLLTPPDPAWLSRAAVAAFRALAEVHDAADDEGPLAIVHADISPANVLLAKDGDSGKILDFALAFGRRWPRATGGAFRGTILYAAPEVARSETFDARADLHALAASLLHAALGAPPRVAPSLAAAIAEASEVPLAAWAERAARPLLPKVADALVCCVAFEASRRPPSARDVLASLLAR